MDSSKLLSRQEIEHRIAEGQSIVISESRVLRLDGWLDKHPGGRHAIAHMVGRDATDEINVYHSVKTLRSMNRYRIGRIENPWINFTPPIRGGIFTFANATLDSEDSDSAFTDSGFEDDGLSSWSSASSVLEGDLSADNGLAGSQGCGAPFTDDQIVIPPVMRRKTFHQRVLDDLHMADGASCEARTIATEPPLCGETPQLTPPPNQQIYRCSPEAYTASVEQIEVDADIAKYPCLDFATQRHITLKYRELHQKIRDEGFYDCRYIEYGKEFIRYSFYFTLFYFALRSEWYITSAALLGLFWHQIMFTAHDAGHMGITHNFKIDTLIGMLVADFCCGLSIGWWKSSHNVHHLVTNHPEHDPDIQNVPLFATGPSFLRNMHSSYYDFTFLWDGFANIAVQFQHYSYYPVMCIARFNLYLLSWLHLLSPRSTNLGSASWTRPTEIAFMLCYWYLFGYLLLWRSIPTWTTRIIFILVSHIITMPLHVQITLSHWAMSTANLGEAESFPQRQLRTTMDVDCPAWLDFIHGGLQFQAVHHLFPRVPRHNLRGVQVLVREFCKEVGIDYKIMGFVDGNKEVLGRLGEVAKQVEILVKCQKYMAETGESGLL